MKNKSIAKIDPNGAKLHLVVLKKKQLFIAVLCIVLCAAFALGGAGIAKAKASSPAYEYVVVIDPGHGGQDGGVTGKNGYKESDFNLAMAKELSAMLDAAGYGVVMTRTDENGLYSDSDSNKKQADMAARKKIILDADPDFIVSIHANKFPGDSRRGAQVFFDEFNDEGKALAESIQKNLNVLNSKHVGKTYDALQGDYYMLKCCSKPSVIVECGFLSNADDEALLSDEEYRRRLAFAVYSGLTAFCENQNKI